VRVSDARPITNITDYVCGTCWNSFSRSDPGVVQGDRLVCPHCGHVLPVDAAMADIASAVRNAPAAANPDSSSFEHDAAPSSVPPRDQGFPELDSVSTYGWLPPDIPAPTAKRESGAGFVVGEPDDFDFGEATLRPDQNHDDLLALVRAAPSRPDSDSGAVQPFVAGDELGVDTDEKTPMDGDEPQAHDARVVIVADGELPAAAMDEALASMETSPGARVADLEPDAAEDFEHRDWKLKAMGLTYNFHGLEPLLNWASNKAGQAMSLSCDGGVVWKDFHSFFDLLQQGLTAQRAFEAGLEPGSAPPPGSTPRTPRTVAKPAGPAAPDLQIPKAPGDAEAAAPDAQVVRPPAATPGTPTTQGSPASSPSRTVPAAGKGAIGPATSPSRRTPVAARQVEQPAGSKAKIAIAVVVFLLAVAALLHFQGIVKIPGLH
jgi:DNA-directed RNA polymerase subunit RPC12/RpoP